MSNERKYAFAAKFTCRSIGISVRTFDSHIRIKYERRFTNYFWNYLNTLCFTFQSCGLNIIHRKKSLYSFNVIAFKFLFKSEFITFNDDKENTFRGNISIKIWCNVSNFSLSHWKTRSVNWTYGLIDKGYSRVVLWQRRGPSYRIRRTCFAGISINIFWTTFQQRRLTICECNSIDILNTYISLC